MNRQEGCEKGGREAGMCAQSMGVGEFQSQVLDLGNSLRMCHPPPAQAGGMGQAGDGGSCHGTANCNQKVVVPARGGGLQLICILLSLQMEACLVADYTGGYLLAKHCTVLIFPFCLFRL